MRSALLASWAAVAGGMVLVACGGGGDSGTPAPVPGSAPAPAPVASTVIMGAAVKGPVANATVTVKDAATGGVLGTAGTDANGAYGLSVPTVSGDVIVEVTQGSYADEATGATVALGTPLRSVVTANGATVTGIVTPLTTLAYTYAFGPASAGVTASAFNTRAASLATQFQLNGVNLATVLPVVSGAINPYGQVLRGLSQFMQSQNVTLQVFTTTTYSTAQWAAFSPLYSSAYNTANPGSAATFSFSGAGLASDGSTFGGY